jgi:hypothetical protein
LREAAELLERQQANPFRVNAYRRAAETLAGLDEDVAALLEQQGIEGLDALPGIGAVLAQAIAQMVRTGRWAQLDRLRSAVAPGVDLLLDVDREYREKAERGALPKIAPRRFNPSGEAWLPILHTERGDWGFTALFSNTALAHALRRVRDWVVIYFHEDSGPEGQRTVVTETRRPLAGHRVVRGRETECFALPDPAGEPPREIGRRDGSC